MANKDLSFSPGDNLQKIDTIAWKLLGREDFRVMAVSTISAKGTPEIRHLICRHSDAEQRSLCFWTDIRSPKIESIRNNDAIAVSIYNDQQKVQISGTGPVRVHHKDQVTLAAWGQATAYSKSAYMRIASGHKIDTRLSGNRMADSVINADTTEPGYENFVVMILQLDDLDYLHLDRQGNSRAHFVYDKTGHCINASWLA